jgi:hypothetical protein
MDGSDQFGNTMGGAPGDGIPQQEAMPMPSTPGYAPPNTPANTPQDPPQAATPYPRGRGSITQYATPAMQHQQQQMYPQSSPYDFSPPPQPSAANNTNLSYAERAALLQKQQPQPVYSPTPQPGGLYPQSQQAALYSSPTQQQQQQAPQQQQPNTSGMSFAQRSQTNMQHQPSAYPPQQQQQQHPQYPQQQQQQHPQYPQQQQQQQPGMMYNASQGSNSMSAAPAPQPPVTGMPQQQPPTSNQYNLAAGSFAQRSAMMQQHPNQYGGGMQQQQQQQPPSPNQYSPRMQQQQYQQQPPQPQYTGGGMPQQQQQQQPPQPFAAGGSYAQRSVSAQSGMGHQQGPPPAVMTPTPGMMPSTTNGPMMGGGPAHAVPKPHNPWEDPPEVVAQQQRLLTGATRKVQEHAYYMKQAMERNDLPAVLDRAAGMVGELGEHAHAHHHHRLHPPPPGATGSTTALSPKNYYELHLRALEELPTLEDYLLNIAQGTASTNDAPPPSPGAPPRTQISYMMKELYDSVQYCPNVLSRLYLQICAGSALIRSGEVGAKWVMKDMIEAVKCVQNPVRGLFLRHYLLQVFKDKLPDEPIPLEEVGPPMSPLVPQAAAAAAEEKEDDDGKPAAIGPKMAVDVHSVEKGTVKDSYQFILANFIEMNKLWVRIQHLPGDGNSKDVRRRRERERNDLRVLVGTNMVRLSALDSVTSSIYGQVILPTVLDQAYLIDCITQVFPDEYHIETMPILLGVCPKLRDKVNIRTIVQGLMDRLANYLADEELLDEKDSNEVKKALAEDSFGMFDECVQNVYNARGPKLQAKEVIRLQTALLAFSKKCYQGNREQVVMCLNHCVVALQQASANQALMQDYQDNNMPQQAPPRVPLDEVATKELEKLLSFPLDDLGLGVLTLEHYSELIAFLPWANRRQVALTMLEAISNKGTPPESIKELEELFTVIAPVLRNEQDAAPTSPQTPGAVDRTANLMAGLGVAPTSQQPGFQNQMSSSQESPEDAAVVSKLIHLLNHQDTDVVYEMLTVARNHLSSGRANTSAFIALVFASLKLAKRILGEELGDPGANEPAKAESKEEEKPAEDEATSGNEDESGDKTEEDAKDEGKEEAKEEDSASEEKTSEPKPVSTPKSVR